MRVFDSSAVVFALLDDGSARRLLGLGDVEVAHLVDVEVASTLRRMVRTGDVTEAAASQALSGWRKLGVRRYAATALLGRIWELRANVSAYDATHVALAEDLECDLVTADRHLAAAPGPRCNMTVVWN